MPWSNFRPTPAVAPDPVCDSLGSVPVQIFQTLHTSAAGLATGIAALRILGHPAEREELPERYPGRPKTIQRTSGGKDNVTNGLNADEIRNLEEGLGYWKWSSQAPVLEGKLRLHPQDDPPRSGLPFFDLRFFHHDVIVSTMFAVPVFVRQERQIQGTTSSDPARARWGIGMRAEFVMEWRKLVVAFKTS
ncbi:hypothetical protein CPLU01_10489 [Colletotrichum plurivorum]|uniref:Uncharacterized protein n=1 Tax=Colletotrichum plurivorum TaxID=2175906 RepID=A0A8H6NA75_9PEZI|nr:hypothetical protein CPLU01_10489 [Colletotrichum plurivorum]